MPKTILYIEDDPASRSLVERTLRYGGYRVLIADCGLDGIDSARREVPDLILTDINLPDMNGREITTMLRGDPRFSTTPIVALTAQTLSEHRELALAAGLTGYMTKPIDVEGLLERVEHYLQGAQEVLDPQALSNAQTRYSRELVARLETRVRELESVNKSLARLDTMKDTFIQLTAHELRTPLTLVYGYSRLIEDNPELKSVLQYDANLRMLIEGLSGSIVRMQSIVNEILLVSRIMTNRIDLSIGPTDLGDIVRKATKTYAEALVERRITVQFNKAEWPERMRADWELLELALRSLLSNAIKFTPDGGTITLRSAIEGEKVRFSIRDTGIGISRETQKTLFERFHTHNDVHLHSTSKTAFRGGGIGLGLAVCKGIIQAHGGEISCASEGYDPQGLPGSEFTVVLPLVTEQQVMVKR
ncbi:MAG: hybrid sensor histidine kinase/response regulator [Chloroflexota bacterium]